MRYVEPITINREEAKTAFDSGDSAAICHALINLAFDEEDWRWLLDTIKLYIHSDDPEIARVAIICIGHIARLHQKIDPEVVEILKSLKTDSVLGGAAEDALGDISIFIK